MIGLTHCFNVTSSQTVFWLKTQKCALLGFEGPYICAW